MAVIISFTSMLFSYRSASGESFRILLRQIGSSNHVVGSFQNIIIRRGVMKGVRFDILFMCIDPNGARSLACGRHSAAGGSFVGDSVGAVGSLVGDFVGFFVGALVGRSDGDEVGAGELGDADGD